MKNKKVVSCLLAVLMVALAFPLSSNQHRVSGTHLSGTVIIQRSLLLERLQFKGTVFGDKYQQYVLWGQQTGGNRKAKALACDDPVVGKLGFVKTKCSFFGFRKNFGAIIFDEMHWSKVLNKDRSEWISIE